jgi:glycosyltransferase involved in cell wall biosynthesis
MPRPRLLAVTHDFTHTGAPIVLFNLLKSLAAEVDLLVAGPAPGPLQGNYIAAGIHPIVVPQLLHQAVMTQALMTSFDCLLANTILSFIPIHGARHAGKPSLWYLHESQFAQTVVQAAGAPAAEAFAIASRVIVPCDASRGFYAAARSNIDVIRYGVAPRPICDIASSVPRKLNVLVLGSIEPRKGQDIAAAAVNSLNDPEIELRMVGQIGPPDFHRALATHYARCSNIRFEPGVTMQDAPAVIDACDVLLVPSRDEVTPMVILEAMAAGKIVVASRVGGVPEMIVPGETGLLFPAEDVAALAALLRQCADDAELRLRLGDNARNFVNAHRTLEHQREAFNNLIQSLV